MPLHEQACQFLLVPANTGVRKHERLQILSGKQTETEDALTMVLFITGGKLTLAAKKAKQQAAAKATTSPPPQARAFSLPGSLDSRRSLGSRRDLRGHNDLL